MPVTEPVRMVEAARVIPDVLDIMAAPDEVLIAICIESVVLLCAGLARLKMYTILFVLAVTPDVQTSFTVTLLFAVSGTNVELLDATPENNPIPEKDTTRLLTEKSDGKVISTWQPDSIGNEFRIIIASVAVSETVFTAFAPPNWNTLAVDMSPGSVTVSDAEVPWSIRLLDPSVVCTVKPVFAVAETGFITFETVNESESPAVAVTPVENKLVTVRRRVLSAYVHVTVPSTFYSINKIFFLRRSR